MNEMRSRHADRLVTRAKKEIAQGSYPKAWQYLEEAHIFSQPDPGMHFYVHWEMFSLGIKEKNLSEVFGQVLRLFLAVPASVFRRYPVGNTGRSNIGMFAEIPLSKKLTTKLKELEKLEKRRIKDGGDPERYQRQHPLSRR